MTLRKVEITGWVEMDDDDGIASEDWRIEIDGKPFRSGIDDFDHRTIDDLWDELRGDGEKPVVAAPKVALSDIVGMAEKLTIPGSGS